MSPDRTPVTPELLADLRAHPPTSHLSPMPAPGLVDLSDVKAPGLVDREHIYDPPDGITYGCPTCTELLDRAKTKQLRVKGPVRLPTKTLKVTTRKTPCGEGSKTWDNWEMTIYKRYIDLECTAGQIKEVTSITIPNGIEINVDFRTTA